MVEILDAFTFTFVLLPLLSLVACSPFVFISFYCEGLVASWSLGAINAGIEVKSIAELAPRVPQPVVGIRVNTSVCSVVLTVAPSREVIEGQALATQPQVTVTTCSGEVVANKVVYALVTEVAGNRLPYLLIPSAPNFVAVKQPVNASAITNGSGVAAFSSLGFQVSTFATLLPTERHRIGFRVSCRDCMLVHTVAATLVVSRHSSLAALVVVPPQRPQAQLSLWKPGMCGLDGVLR